MTLLYLLIFKIILFLVYHSYVLGLVSLDLYTCLGSYSVYPSNPWVNDRYCVGFIDSYIVPLSTYKYDKHLN